MEQCVSSPYALHVNVVLLEDTKGVRLYRITKLLTCITSVLKWKLVSLRELETWQKVCRQEPSPIPPASCRKLTESGLLGTSGRRMPPDAAIPGTRGGDGR
jgi:hypothetical protein